MTPQIAYISPPSLLAGAKAEFAIHGLNLTADTIYDFGPGLGITNNKYIGNYYNKLTIAASVDATAGLREITVTSGQGDSVAYGLFEVKPFDFETAGITPDFGLPGWSGDVFLCRHKLDQNGVRPYSWTVRG